MSVFYLFKTEEKRKAIPYNEHGDKWKIKIADMNKLVKQVQEERIKDGKSMIVEIKALRTYRDKEIGRTIKFVKDPVSDIHYGVAVGEFPDGNIRWRGIYLTDYNSFNLSNDFECQCYIVLRMHPDLKGCPIKTAIEPSFEILDPNEIASEKLNKGMLLQSALHKINTMQQNQVEQFARFMNVPMGQNTNTKFLKSLLVDAAMADPGYFLNAYKDPYRPLYEMIAIAKYKSVILFSTEKGHTFGQTFLGYTVPDVARNLESQTLILSQIRSKLEEIGANYVGEEDEAKTEKEEKEE